ncbi:MAG: hypothetical protein JO348_14855 [Alphaproteobacteria bacterium]|nr:hypothetical protein [Alphaproteobacteria bacterium]MBV9421045.1 hypothetical protein [Alphaproteobacteria bacterium]MBV9540923.1 hypothetical protein [Alphaproteobacteria bacterium]MBV9904819.1 hypothetical protein [Alphaproteobacteria bacterium]
MADTWSKEDMAELRHHMRMLWLSFDPANKSGDNAYDDFVDEGLKLCMDKRSVNEFTGFVDWVCYKKFNLTRTVERDEANAAFAKKVYAWYRDCELLFGSVGDE